METSVSDFFLLMGEANILLQTRSRMVLRTDSSKVREPNDLQLKVTALNTRATDRADPVFVAADTDHNGLLHREEFDAWLPDAAALQAKALRVGLAANQSEIIAAAFTEFQTTAPFPMNA